MHNDPTQDGFRFFPCRMTTIPSADDDDDDDDDVDDDDDYQNDKQIN